MTLKQLRALVALATSGLLAACGGGSTTPVDAPVAPTAATVVTGTVTGFGGVAIDGVSYTNQNAAVALDVDPRSETAGTMADVKLGQQVEALADAGGNLTKITVRAAVIGPVESVNAATSSFQVLGQTIKVVTTGDAQTVFEGIASLADLKAGDWVEVHGTIDADKNVVATRVEVQPAAGVIRLRAGGIVKNLTTSASSTTFQLGSLTVDASQATIRPDGATLANDQLVFVYAEALPVNGVLAAKSIRVARLPMVDGRRFSIGGLVTDAAADGKTFKVNGISVDASSAELKGGQSPSFADIKNMVLVRVEGTLSGSGSALAVKATRVWILPASEQRGVLLTGQVTDFVSAASFKVLGVPVDASGAQFAGGTAADLKAGAFVTIKGRVSGDMVKADQVRFNPPPANVPVTLFGVVSNYNNTTGEFTLLGIPMKLDPAATFTGGTQADFADGAVVTVKGSFNSGAFIVTAVQFKPSAMTPLVYLSGTISNVSAAGFTLNGATVKLTSATQIVGGPLANGQRVEVTGTLSGTDVVARKVEVQVPGATAMLRGPVADLKTDVKTFTVNGQRVDYSAATFVGGTAADLANGRQVRVTGTIDAGTVKATQVMLLPSMM
jgi:hypothetical protein